MQRPQIVAPYILAINNNVSDINFIMSTSANVKMPPNIVFQAPKIDQNRWFKGPNIH